MDVTVIASRNEPVDNEARQTKDQILRLLKEKNINLVTNKTVKEVTPNSVILSDDSVINCDVAVWATGAEPQKVSAESDLELMKGFFRVNKYLQSTSHPNVFAGGDCITMEDYHDKPYPTKAGVYAVRAGPIIAQNLVNYAENKDLVEYVPQKGFLSLMMTGDGQCIGSKFGIGFYGKWVWELKDFIDMSFMDLFNPKYLYNDYANKGMAEPVESSTLFDDHAGETKTLIEASRKKVETMTAEEAAKIFGCSSDETEFHDRFQILTRMNTDKEFRAGVVNNFKPPYGVNL